MTGAAMTVATTFVLAVTEGTALTVWGVSLGLGAVVLLVVAFLLSRIKVTASVIDTVAGRIWTEGKLVANHTIQIPLFLSTTNRVAGQIKSGAVGIVGASEAIEQHAAGCPGCPACLLDN